MKQTIIILIITALVLTSCADEDTAIADAQGFASAWNSQDWETLYTHFSSDLKALRSQEDFTKFLIASGAENTTVRYDKGEARGEEVYVYYIFSEGYTFDPNGAVHMIHEKGMWRIDGFKAFFTSNCVVNCDDANLCTTDVCTSNTDFICENNIIENCDGNHICEEGEFPQSGDCPVCDDNDDCTNDGYNYETGRCTVDLIEGCYEEKYEVEEEPSFTELEIQALDLEATYADSYTMSDFLRAFTDGDLIVLGQNAPGIDAVSGILIATKMNVEGVKLESVMDTEISDLTDHSAILVGSPCVNKFIAALLSVDLDECDEYTYSRFNEGEGIIEIYENEGEVYIIVVGYTPTDTRNAARVLSNFDEYNLLGNKCIVKGSSANCRTEDD
ncbi:MAG: hypothetical protein GY861_24920 [bacterium]|nr:hypothetical protein [bacterium]